MGADRGARVCAAGAEALHGPADFGAVGDGEVARVRGGDLAGGGGAVEGRGIGEGGEVGGFRLRFVARIPLIAAR